MSALPTTNARWLLRPAPPEEALRPLVRIGLPPLIARLLWQRGIRTPREARTFLHPDYRTLHDPFRMLDLERAVDRILRALATREPFVVYGDYDADGVTASTLLAQGFRALKGDVRVYIPHRVEEGYGLHADALRRIAADGVRLVVTVDCGISNRREAELARQLGIDLIVTDHHTPPPELPDAYAVLNPKRPGDPYPYKELTGVGVAFKLLQGVARRVKGQGRPLPFRGRDLLDLVALGTVADVAPLTEENRILVHYGLQALAEARRPGVRALKEAARLNWIDAEAIGFGLAPRLNASGRLEHARLSYDLLQARDLASARRLAGRLEGLNRRRQQLTQRLLETAIPAAAAQVARRPLIFLADEAFAAGVVGLVAGRLAERFHRPAFLIERGPELSKGSARGIPGFNVVEALRACEDLLVKYGGHTAAGGFTVPTAQLPELEARLAAFAERTLTEEDLRPRLELDAELALQEVTWDLWRALAPLEPFGPANPRPLFWLRDVRIRRVRPVGDGSHLQLLLEGSGGHRVEAIAFRQGEHAAALEAVPWADLAVHLNVDRWNGRERLRLQVAALRPRGRRFF